MSGFLPFIKISVLGSTITKNLAEGGDGYFILAIGIIALMCCLNEKYIATVISGVVSLALFAIESYDLTSKIEDNVIVQYLIQKGAGYYALLVGSIALIVFALLARNEKQQREQERTQNNDNDYYR